jgi:hypothetical protein
MAKSKGPKPLPQHRGAQKGENPRTGQPAAHAGGANQKHAHNYSELISTVYPTGAHVKPNEGSIPVCTYKCVCGGHGTEERMNIQLHWANDTIETWEVDSSEAAAFGLVLTNARQADLNSVYGLKVLYLPWHMLKFAAELD